MIDAVVIPSTARDRPVTKRSLAALGMTAAALGMTVLFAVAHLSAQDTTRAYPWRLSYFPYLTASPNDGVMAMGRAVLFQQSRWDARTSIDKEVAVEGGYSTLGSWAARGTANLPRLDGAGRFQFSIFAEHDARFVFNPDAALSANRQGAAAEFSIPLERRVYATVRTTGTHLDLSGVTEMTLIGRLGMVVDLRDREYDTRAGALLEAGAIGGYAGQHVTAVSHGFSGWYGMGRFWVPLGKKTRVTGRAAYRLLSESATSSIEANRSIPAWEGDVVALGGPQSDRTLTVGEYAARSVGLLSGEIRHDLKVFPGGAIALVAFVDAGDATNPGDDVSFVTSAPGAAPTPTTTTPGWVVGAGGGVAVRLLRNAVLSATVGRALGATRVYVSSGWSW